MDAASLVISIVALLVSLGSAYRSNKIAEQANQKADDANKISQGANTLAQSANIYASEANVISKQGIETSQKTYENQYVPKITFQYGSGGDLTTNPPAEFFQIRAVNEGYIPILIQWIGFSVVGSQVTAPIFTLDVTQGHQQPLLPAEILPGRVLDFSIPIDSFQINLQLHAKGLDDEFTIRLVQQSGQHFETARLKVKDYLGDELPIRLRFHEGPPPHLADHEPLPQTRLQPDEQERDSSV